MFDQHQERDNWFIIYSLTNVRVNPTKQHVPSQLIVNVKKLT